MTQPKDQNGTWSTGNPSSSSPSSSNPSSSVRPGLGSELPRTSPSSEPLRTGGLVPSSTPMRTPGTTGMSGATGEPRSTERIREDIARTRSALSDDVAALGDKLNPENLKESAKEVIHHASSVAREGAKDMVRDAKEAALGSLRHAKDHAFDSISEGMHQITYRARVAGHTFADFVATHAVPLALAGAGLGWLLISMSHQRRMLGSGGDYRYEGGDYRYEHEGLIDQARARAGALTSRASEAIQEKGERVMERAHDLQDRVAGRAGELRTQIKEGASHLGEQASALGHRAYEGIGRAGRGAAEISERNPLVTGLLALAAGVAAALLLPPTRRENQWMGGTRDRLVDKAQRSASELKQSVQQSAEELKGAISEVTHPAH